MSNEKYTGTVRLQDTEKSGVQYIAEENNPPIIPSETFQAVEIEKARRSNVVRGKDGIQQKGRKYCSKE